MGEFWVNGKSGNIILDMELDTESLHEKIVDQWSMKIIIKATLI